MATKYQDSTPQRTIWRVGQENLPHAWNQWGYDTTLYTFDASEGIIGGEVAIEGYCGFHDEDNTEWGSWFDLRVIDVATGEQGIGIAIDGAGKKAYWVKTVGFSQIRARLTKPLQGEGQVQVVLACHAV